MVIQTIVQSDPQSFVGAPVTVANGVGAAGTPSMSRFREFKLPLEKLPAELVACLKNKQRPSPALRRHMVRIICADITEICLYPGRRHLRMIAQNIVESFPQSLCDIIGDSTVGSGFDSLVLQLETRLDNMNRGTSGAKRSVTFSDAADASAAENSSGVVSKKRQAPRDCYGCVNWNPTLRSCEDEEKAVSAREKMKEFYSIASGDKENCNVKDLMLQSYSLQRQQINEGANALELKAAWPYLFTHEGLDIHFSELTGVQLIDSLRKATSGKVVDIEQYFTANSSDPRIREVLIMIASAKHENGNGSGSVLGMMYLLCTFFKENISSLLTAKDVSICTAQVTYSLKTMISNSILLSTCGVLFLYVTTKINVFHCFFIVLMIALGRINELICINGLETAVIYSTYCCSTIC